MCIHPCKSLWIKASAKCKCKRLSVRVGMGYECVLGGNSDAVGVFVFSSDGVL